jgi:hypothetical protein
MEEILAHLQSGTLEGADEPALVYRSCYRVLEAVEDPRAVGVLEEGYQLLQEIAAKFTDEDLRRSFLENVAAHREIVAEYARLDQSRTCGSPRLVQPVRCEQENWSNLNEPRVRDWTSPAVLAGTHATPTQTSTGSSRCR